MQRSLRLFKNGRYISQPGTAFGGIVTLGLPDSPKAWALSISPIRTDRKSNFISGIMGVANCELGSPYVFFTTSRYLTHSTFPNQSMGGETHTGARATTPREAVPPIETAASGYGGVLVANGTPIGYSEVGNPPHPPSDGSSGL